MFIKRTDKSLTRWIDGRATPTEAARFEQSDEARRERAEWQTIADALRRNAQEARLPHPDFFNQRIHETIAGLEKSPRPAASPSPAGLARLAWIGVALLLIGILGSAWMLPSALQPVDREALISQIISARTSSHRIQAYSFQSSEGAAVLWIEGADYIPAKESIR